MVAGKIISNKHPTKDLYILNYTRTTQFEKAWDEVTLACRGLVVDGSGSVVARPLPKFFNDFEYAEGEIPYHLPHEAFIKYDGSLGIVFKHEGEVIIASRGSFASEQCLMAKDIFNREPEAARFILPGFTFAFEIIYPSNRIVVDYGKTEMLVLLAAFHTSTGAETPHEELSYWFDRHFKGQNSHLKMGEKVQLDCVIGDYRSTIEGADEGYIVRFQNGFRMKIKGAEYCRLHSILTHVSNKSIWESLKGDKPLDEILDRIPDEFDAWVEKTISGFMQKFKEIEEWHRQVMEDYMDDFPDQKSFAINVLNYCKTYGANSGIIFAMRNGQEKKWKNIIWDMIYPKFEKAAKTVQDLKEDELPNT